MLESFCKWQHEEFGKKNDIHLEMSTSWGGHDLSGCSYTYNGEFFKAN